MTKVTADFDINLIYTLRVSDLELKTMESLIPNLDNFFFCFYEWYVKCFANTFQIDFFSELSSKTLLL